MATKLYFIAPSPPAPTSGSTVAKNAPLSPAELDQNFANLRKGIDLLVGEASNQSEENALFAAGYRFVVRLDLIPGYVPPASTTTTTSAGTTTTTTVGGTTTFGGTTSTTTTPAPTSTSTTTTSAGTTTTVAGTTTTAAPTSTTTTTSSTTTTAAPTSTSTTTTTTTAAPLSAPVISGSTNPAQVTITWGAISGATHYHVYGGEGLPTFGSYSYTSGAVSGTSFTFDSGLPTGDPLSFVVYAHDATRTSAASNYVSVTPVAAPGQVTGLSVSNSPAQITATWTARPGGENVTSYDLYYRDGSAPTTSTYDGVVNGITGTSHTINGPLTAGHTYYICVRAVSAGGAGALSTAGSAAAAAVSFTPITDNFNRGALGDNWSMLSSSVCDLSANNFGIAAEYPGAIAAWVATTISANQYSEAKIVAPGSGGVFVRQSGASLSDNAYIADVYISDGSDGMSPYNQVLELYKYVDGEFSYLGDLIETADRYIHIRAVGTTITVKTKYNSGDAWITRITVTDSDLSSGRPGIEATVDDWAGGNL